jgi:hypothetical protein
MKQILSVLAVGVLLLVSCKNESQPAAQNTTDTPVTQPAAPPVEKVTPPASVAALFTPDQGVLRGVDFTATPAKLAELEKTSPLKKTATNVTYSTDLDADNFADVKYTFKGEQLNKIEVDIFAKDQAAAETFHKDLTAYFDKKYQKRATLWDGTDNNTNFTVFEKPIVQTKNFGTYIVFERTN